MPPCVTMKRIDRTRVEVGLQPREQPRPIGMDDAPSETLGDERLEALHSPDVEARQALEPEFEQRIAGGTGHLHVGASFPHVAHPGIARRAKSST